MSEIEFLTDPIQLNKMEQDFWKIPLPVDLVPFNQKKNTVPVHSTKNTVRWPDWINDERDLSFTLVYLINLIQSHLSR